MRNAPQSHEHGVSRSGMGDNGVLIHVAWLMRQRRLLLYGGGTVLTILIVAVWALGLWLHIEDFCEAQRKAFDKGKLALDAMFIQRDAAYLRTVNTLEYDWQFRQGMLEKQGRDFIGQYHIAMSTALVSGPGGRSPWLVLGRADQFAKSDLAESDFTTPDFTERDLAVRMGLVTELSVITSTLTAGRKWYLDGTTAYYVDAKCSLIALLDISEAKLPGSDRKARIKNLCQRSRDALDIGARAPREGISSFYLARIPRIHTLLATPPGGAAPAIVGSFAVMDRDKVVGVVQAYERVQRFIDRLDQESSGRFTLLTPQGDVVLRTKPPNQATAGPGIDMIREAARGGQMVRKGAWFHIVGSLSGADWLLVLSYSVSDLFEGILPALVSTSPIALAMIAGLWLLFTWLDRRIFLPSMSQAVHIFQSEALNRAMLETSPVGLCLIDIQGQQPIMKNDVCRALEAEYGGEEVFYKTIISRFRLMDHSERSQFELRAGPDGATPRCLLAMLTPTTYRGRPAVLCAFSDVSMRAELESRLRQAKRDSESACTAAESASRAKSQFVATVSHEIRTPLNGILGHLELLELSSLESSQSVRVQKIRRSVDTLMSIVGDVLDLSKIESGKVDIDEVKFDIRATVANVALLYAAQARAKGLDLLFRVEADVLEHYMGGRARIEQVLRNLISNAIKFTSCGRVMLRVSLCQREPHRVRFEVIDSGIGMDDAQIRHIFDPFAQADASIAQRFGGTGLGLFLCRQMTELMGGTIGVKSTPGVGSSFHIELPLATTGDTSEHVWSIFQGSGDHLLGFD